MGRFHNARMSAKAPRASGTDIELEQLGLRIDELIALCERLKEENQSLRQKQDALVNERAGLLQKNELVRSRVEAMIGRLRAMEQG